MTQPITEEALRRKLLAIDRTSEEKRLGAHGQHPELVEWAEAHGYQLVGYLLENGISGATPILLRDTFVDAIRQVRDDPAYAGIIIPSTERLARDKGAFDEMLYAMSWAGKHLYVGIHDRHGRLVDIHDHAGPEAITQRHDRQIRELRASIARTELLLDAQRARRAKIARCGYGGGRLQPPWFMDRVDIGDGHTEFTPNPGRLQWALWISDRHHEGWSYGRIARELNRHGLTTAQGCQFTHKQAARVCERIDSLPAHILAIWTADAGNGLRPAVGRTRELVA